MNTLSPYTRRNPFFREFDALVRSTFGPAAGTGSAGRAGFTPSAGTIRDGDDAVVRLEVPGIDADDVDVELAEGRLVVRGERRDERRDEHTEDAEGRRLREIRYGRFERSFGLPRHVVADAVSASYDAGVLSVRVAGLYAGTEPRRITVTAPVQAPAGRDDEAPEG